MYHFVQHSIVCLLLATTLWCSKAVAQTQSARAGKPPAAQAQLYLAAVSFVSFTKGHLQKQEEPSKDGKVTIRECFTDKPIRVEKAKLTPLDGDCYSNYDSGPPWNPQRSTVGVIDSLPPNGSVQIRTADDKVISLTPDAWKKAIKDTAISNFGTPPKPQVGDFVGGIKAGVMKELYLIEKKPLKSDFND